MKQLLILIGLLLLSGCGFSRIILNPETREINTSWIVPGKTTKAEIIKKIGMPPTMRGVGGVKKDSFRWVCYDTFVGKLEVGYIVTPTFERGKEHYSEDILVMFDKNNVVKLVSRTRSDGNEVQLVEWREK